MGVLNSSGKLILFADADGATKFADFENVRIFPFLKYCNFFKVERELIRSMGGQPIDESFPGVSIGSR